MANTFKPGDIVQLKSGGPKMTITRLTGEGEIAHTAWFSGSKHETGSFPVATLISADNTSTK